MYSIAHRERRHSTRRWFPRPSSRIITALYIRLTLRPSLFSTRFPKSRAAQWHNRRIRASRRHPSIRRCIIIDSLGLFSAATAAGATSRESPLSCDAAAGTDLSLSRERKSGFVRVPTFVNLFVRCFLARSFFREKRFGRCSAVGPESETVCIGELLRFIYNWISVFTY